MMEGHNVAPGTPVENLNAMAETAARFRSFYGEISLAQGSRAGSGGMTRAFRPW